MKLGLYLRISIDQGDATERQEEACRTWATRNGHEIVGVYEDRESGYKKQLRAGFERLLIAGHEGILCWRIDRLLRNWRDWARLDELLDAGTVLFTEDGTDSRRDGAILAIKVAFAKEESRRIGERLRNKLEAQAKAGQGRAGGNRPFGYTRQWEVVPEEAAELRAAIDHILAGGSMNSIVRDWNKRGITTSTGRAWSVTVLRNCLLRPSLAGLRVHRSTVHQGAWEPLVTMEEHETLKAIFSRPRSTSVVRAHFATGMVFCGRCGAKMQVQKRAYTCPACRRCSLKVEFVEREVEAAAKSIAIQTPRAKPRSSEKILAQIRAIEARLQRATDMAVDGMITKEEYRQQRARLEPALQELRLQTVPPPVEVKDFNWERAGVEERAEYLRQQGLRFEIPPPGRGNRKYRRGLVVPIFPDSS